MKNENIETEIIAIFLSFKIYTKHQNWHSNRDI